MLESREVVFARRVHFLGRNGTGFCTGITAYFYPDGPPYRANLIQIQPITSKGYPGRCEIEVPLESVDALIEVLSKLRDEAVAHQEKSENSS